MNILGQPCLKLLQRLALLKLYHANGNSLSAEIERTAEISWVTSNHIASFERELNELGRNYQFRSKLAEVCSRYEVIFVQTWYRLYPESIDPNRVFMHACASGHLAVAIWVAETFPVASADIEHIFWLTCVCGHLAIAKWLTETFSDISIRVGDVFEGACANGHLSTAKWLLGSFPGDMDYNRAFIEACRHGHLPIAKWLEEISPRAI